MSQEVGHAELQEQTQQLLNGPLKHIRAAALAAALLPLASVAAAPASAQDSCLQSSGTVCGFVFNDTNGNGFQDAGETGIPDAPVYLVVNGDPWQFVTGPDGFYFFDVPDGTYQIFVEAPQGMLTSPSPDTGDDTTDSDGDPDGFGNSVTTVTVVGGNNPDTDFGFFTPSVQRPGTGTPGYWKNHPEAWPVDRITVGGVTYTKAQAIALLGKVGKDKTMTMFSSLVPARLNLLMGTDPSCVSTTIAAADDWLAAYPVGSNVAASSYAWSVGEPLHIWMDNYNNGRLCNPHRN